MQIVFFPKSAFNLEQVVLTDTIIKLNCITNFCQYYSFQTWVRFQTRHKKIPCTVSKELFVNGAVSIVSSINGISVASVTVHYVT